MHEGSRRSNEVGGPEQPDLPTEEELEEGIKAVQAAVAAAEHEEALQQPFEPLQDPHVPSGWSFAHDVSQWSLYLAHLGVECKLFRCGLKGLLPRQSSLVYWSAGVFVGVAGQDTAFGVDGHDWDDSQRQMSREKWKRMTYPAGRIMHLLPRHLVTGAPQPLGPVPELPSWLCCLSRRQSPPQSSAPTSDIGCTLCRGAMGWCSRCCSR
jgi:hypothetical protein